MRKSFFLFFFFSLCIATSSQTLLQPGFNGEEYRQLLQIFRQQSRVSKTFIPAPEAYTRLYSSPEVGLKNQWEMWQHKTAGTLVISIRGTVADQQSWLENFYAAMVPATGSLQLTDSTLFTYRLANNTNAMVHVGWLVGLGFLAQDIVTHIKDAYSSGQKSFILFGHSQGAAITFLLRSYLHYQVQEGQLPNDIVFKTYCSAAPKPGNTYFAYDYDFITRNGWGYTVVNMADWVPENPFSVQTLNDFNPVNPFINVGSILKSQPLLVRLYLASRFKKLNKSTRKAQKRFQKYLGKQLYTQVKKALPQFKQPDYAAGNNYQRAGSPIVLQPDEAYWKQYSNNTNKIFEHHLLEPYYLLSSIYYP